MTISFNDAVAMGLEELYRRRDELASQEDFDRTEYNVITNAINHLEAIQGAEQEAEERRQEIEQKWVINLPRDYNEVFRHPKANEEIEFLLRQQRDQLTGYYEGILVEKDEENVRAIRDLHAGYEEQIVQLQRQNKELQAICNGQEVELKIANEQYEQLHGQFSELKRQFDALQAANNDLRRERDDALQKRDAAAREVQSLKAQIDELEQMLAAYKKPKNEGFTLNLTSGIEEDRPAPQKEEEDRRIKSSVELALERVGLTHMMPPRLRKSEETAGPAQPAAETSAEADSFQPTDEIPAIQPTEGRDTADTALEGTEGAGDYVTRAEFEALKADVEALKQRFGAAA
jgi:chromosome segregation ATPase